MGVGEELAVDDVGEASFERSHGLAAGLALGSAGGKEGLCSRVVAGLGERDYVDRVVEPAVVATVEAVLG